MGKKELKNYISPDIDLFCLTKVYLLDASGNDGDGSWIKDIYND